jgi:hypothetical protein
METIVTLNPHSLIRKGQFQAAFSQPKRVETLPRLSHTRTQAQVGNRQFGKAFQVPATIRRRQQPKMSYPSQHTDEEWQTARTLVENAIPMPEVAERLGISYENLKKKAQRNNWFVPATALAKAQTALTERQNKETGESLRVPVEAHLAESIAEMGQKGQIAVLQGLLPKIRETFRENSALLAKEIESWKDAGTAFSIFAKASGLDKPQQAVQINMWGQASGTVSGPDIPLDCTQIDSDASDGS